ncbi:MAG: hypothetical protein COB93_05755 [Sneathiella sp.]|nr:MAG: hypothetical protein COB93_05755 [Sneathiella sp.]
MEKAEAGFASAFNVERLGREAISFNIEATTAECQYLAAQLDILGVSEMTAKGRLQRQPKSGLISVTGRIQTSVTQACVVTLEPVPQKVDTEFTVLFTFDKDDLEMEETDRVVGMDEQDLKILTLQSTVNNMPGKDEMHQLQLMMTEMAGDMKAVREGMRGLRDGQARQESILGRHEDHLRGENR